MNWAIDHGLAFYWGTSEWTASQIMESYGICDRLGLKRPVVEQSHYNMLYRNQWKSIIEIYSKNLKWEQLFGLILKVEF